MVHGGGVQIDRALKEKEISTEKEGGVRATSEEAMGVIEGALKKVNEEIVERADFDCRGLHGIFEAEPIQDYTAKVVGIQEEARQSLDREETTVVSPVGRFDGEYYNINADSAWRQLVTDLRPAKAIVLTGSGGVYRDGALQYDIRPGQLDEFIDRHATGGMSVKLKEVSRLTEEGFDVQIASPENLIHELFTRKGQGTYVHSQ